MTAERRDSKTSLRWAGILACAASVLGIAALATTSSRPGPARLGGVPAASLLQLGLHGPLTSPTASASVTAGPLAISATASVDLGLEGLESPVCGITGLCVRIVTHHEAPSGSGVVREYDILPGIGDVGTLPGTPIDATGDGIPDLAVAVGVPPSGLPTIVDRQRPQIKIDRAAGAPASLPVKVEAVINDDLVPNGKISFGYDTRGSTAPTSFIARTDLRDRDGDAATEQKKVDLTISRGPSDRVALVTETFTARAGPGESQRTSREITRLTSS